MRIIGGNQSDDKSPLPELFLLPIGASGED